MSDHSSHDSPPRLAQLQMAVLRDLSPAGLASAASIPYGRNDIGLRSQVITGVAGRLVRLLNCL